MKRNKDELVEIVKKFIADRTDDEAISLLEDVSDSFVTDGEGEWKKKFDEMTEKYNGMVKKYTDRFGQSESNTDTQNQSTGGDTNTFGVGTLEDNFDGGI